MNLKPSVLLYSAFSADVPTYVAFDAQVKEALDVRSIIGGPGPTYDWSIAERCTIDAICVGEGEFALEEYILGGCAGGKNVILRGEKEPSGYFPFADLDSLPFPDRDQVYEADAVVRSMSSRQFLSGRGCPYKCTYCFNNAFNQMFQSCGRAVRKKSVDYLIDEIRNVKGKYPFQTVVFQDDTFIADKKWLFEFCERFPRDMGLPYTCNVRANLVDEEAVSALSSSGCTGVNWSIESGNDFLRNEVLKRRMSRAQIIETGRLLNKHGIPHRIGNIVGLPGETFENMLETLQMNIDAKPQLALANVFVPFPSLELTDYALAHGCLSPENAKNVPRTFFKESVLNFSRSEKSGILKLLYLFPIMARHPVLFRRKTLRKALLAMPKAILRGLYEVFYACNMARLYRVRPSLRQTFLIISRYVRDM